MTEAQLRNSASKKPSLIPGEPGPGLPSDILHCHCVGVLLFPTKLFIHTAGQLPFAWELLQHTVLEHLFPLSHLLGAGDTDNSECSLCAWALCVHVWCQ